MREKIGEWLLQAGLITDGDLRGALAEQTRTGERLGAVLVRLNLATEQHLAAALAFQLGFRCVKLAEYPPDPAAIIRIGKDLALKHGCVAIALANRRLTVATAEPLQFGLLQDLENQTGCRIDQVVSTRTEILDAIQTGYPDTPLSDDTNSVLRFDEETPEPIADAVDLVVRNALEAGASDIHIEPTGKGVVVRHRLDGVLKEVIALPGSTHEGLIAGLKQMAGIDIAETRLPQDGRLRAQAADGRDVDFRVSTMRTVLGEKVVLRALERRRDVPALEELGLSAASLQELQGLLRQRQGMIFIAGPTGSGKTTTLNSALSALSTLSTLSPAHTNIVTIEDPVEYQLAGVNQTQIDGTTMPTFAAALRTILARDPDVVMLGEICDGETASLAMQAAQTGHLVLSALSAGDAPSSVTRLMAMGVEPAVVAAALLGVVAQRLVRRLCVHCRRPYTPAQDVLQSLGIPDADAATLSFHQAAGCDQCNHTGYRGRIGIFEVMRVTARMRQSIAARAPEEQLRAQATAGGMATVGEDGLAKVKSGITTAEELLRVMPELRELRTICAGCGIAVSTDFIVCPACGKRIGGGCSHCGRAVQTGWNYCPYCARRAEPRNVPLPVQDRHIIVSRAKRSPRS